MIKEAFKNGFAKRVKEVLSGFNGNTLKARCARGGIVLGGGGVVGKGMQLVRYMIMTRVLAPSELGLMAIVLSATVLFETVFEVGVKSSVIQNKSGADPGYLNVAWWFQVVRGSALFIVGFVAAPLVSRFYGNAELLSLLRVTLLALVFKGAMSPGTHVLEKKFKFTKVVLLTYGSSLAGTVVVVTLVFLFRNAWALVIGYVFEALIMCVFSFVMCPFIPKFKINTQYLKQIVGFARGMFGLPVLTMIAFEIDVMILGKLVPMALLGMYMMARRLAQTPREFFSRIFTVLLLPAFSEKQEDPLALHSAVIKITTATAMFAIPLAVFLVFCSKSILSVVFGSQYASVAVAFSLLSICMLVRMQGITLGAIYLAIGQPHLHRRFAAVRTVLIVSLIYPAVIVGGTVGAAGIVLFAEVVALVVQVAWMQRRIGLRLGEYWSCWLSGLCVGQIVSVPILVLRMFTPMSVYLNVVIGGALCLTAWAIGLFLFKTSPAKYERQRTEAQKILRDYETRAKYA